MNEKKSLNTTEGTTPAKNQRIEKTQNKENDERIAYLKQKSKLAKIKKTGKSARSKKTNSKLESLYARKARERDLKKVRSPKGGTKSLAREKTSTKYRKENEKDSERNVLNLSFLSDILGYIFSADVIVRFILGLIGGVIVFFIIFSQLGLLGSL